LLDGVLRYGPTTSAARIHPLAVVHEPEGLGPDTVVWQFSTLMPGVRTGAHCSIGSNTHVGRNTVLGESVRVGDKVHITDHMVIGDRVFIAPLAVMANDRHPVVNNPHFLRESPVIESDVSIGVGAVILPGVRLGRGCQIGAGAVVTKDVSPGAVVVGNPAHVLRPAPDWDGAVTLCEEVGS
jgi:acetyltransferase-like isoleucine patch superfamily enzyme